VSTNLYPTDSGLTYLLHDLSADGGTYQTILLYKLLAVTRETKVTLIKAIAQNVKSKMMLECGTNPTNGNTGAS